MNNNVRDDKTDIVCEREENDKYSSNEKRIDVPEWNENVQKIIVGYH